MTPASLGEGWGARTGPRVMTTLSRGLPGVDHELMGSPFHKWYYRTIAYQTGTSRP
jgi:hypothetical protein